MIGLCAGQPSPRTVTVVPGEPVSGDKRIVGLAVSPSPPATVRITVPVASATEEGDLNRKKVPKTTPLAIMQRKRATPSRTSSKRDQPRVNRPKNSLAEFMATRYPPGPSVDGSTHWLCSFF